MGKINNNLKTILLNQKFKKNEFKHNIISLQQITYII